MSRRASRPVSLARVACVVAVLGAASTARADPQTVVLQNGSRVTGEVVEYVVGDHVTLALPNGGRIRIEWSALAAPPAAPQVGAPAAPPVAEPPPPYPYPEPGEAARLEETRPAYQRDPGYGMSTRLSVGVETGFPAPLGYLAFVANYFPFRWPVIRAFGIEVAVAPPIANEPTTLAESLLMEIPQRSWGIGAGLGVAQSFVKPVIPGEHPGVVNTIMADLTHLTIRIIPQLAVRAGWGYAVFINGGYCETHAGACPQLASAASDLSFYGHLTVLWTFDFARAPP